MHAPGPLADHLGQCVHIRPLELGQFAVFEDQLGDRVVRLDHQLGEDLGVG